jgi:hypothetical protein
MKVARHRGRNAISAGGDEKAASAGPPPLEDPSLKEGPSGHLRGHSSWKASPTHAVEERSRTRVHYPSAPAVALILSMRASDRAGTGVLVPPGGAGHRRQAFGAIGTSPWMMPIQNSTTATTTITTIQPCTPIVAAYLVPASATLNSN